MSIICELYFSKKKFPSHASKLEEAYSLYGLYEEALKKLKKELPEQEEMKILKRAIFIADSLAKADSNFSVFLSTPKNHNKKREKALNEVPKAVLEKSQPLLKELKELETRLSCSLQKVLRLLTPCRELSKQIKEITEDLEKTPDLIKYIYSLKKL